MTVRIVGSTPVSGVRAGSALLAVGDRLLVVGDDATAVTWLEPATGAATHLALAGGGGPLPKLLKPDLEAAVATDDGEIWLLGSGSLPTRRTTYRLAGPGHATVTAHDAGTLYDALAAHLPEPPNIEGAVAVGGIVRLFHRATGSRPDVVLDVPQGCLAGEGAAVLAVTELVLPRVAGVPAHVTDAALGPDGRIALLAAAEDTPDAVADGPVSGCLFGDLGSGAWAPILEEDGTRSVRKAEGLVLDPDGRGGWFVTDADDPAQPAELCRFRR